MRPITINRLVRGEEGEKEDKEYKQLLAPTMQKPWEMRSLLTWVDEKQKKPGGWTTMPFIIGNEFCEKLGSIGLFWNLILYMVQDYHMKQVTAANVLNIVAGSSSISPIIGGYIADTYLSRFWTVLIASMINLVGMTFFLLTAVLPSVLKPPQCPAQSSLCQHASQGQLAFLYMAFLFTIISSAGIRPCAYAFGADQFSQNTEEERRTFQSFFNWYFAAIYMAVLLSATVIVYLQSNVSWGWGFGVLTILMAISVLVFIAGTPFYKYVPSAGSPLKGFARVAAAAYGKRHLPLPSDNKILYDVFDKEGKVGKLSHTNQFGFLDKAAVVLPGDLKEDGKRGNPWRLCSVHEVEEMKVLIRIVPIWAAGMLHATAVAQQGTFLVLQAKTMDRRMGSSFQIPAGSLGVFSMLALILWLPFYDCCVLPIARRVTGHERGITFLQRIGVGYVLGVVAMVLSGVVEGKRRSVAWEHGLANNANKIVPMSVFWLVPQLCLTGLAESFNGIGQTEFYYDQMPESLRSSAGGIGWLSFGIGIYMSSIILTLVHKFTGKHGHDNWLADNLNMGHLDYFYYLIAGLLILNLAYFLICTRGYSYKKLYIEEKCEENETLTHI